MAILITGAAGFIGSNLARHFVKEGIRVFGVDNYCLGRSENIADFQDDPMFDMAQLDASDFEALLDYTSKFHQTEPIDTIWHLAANSDIPAGTADAGIDLKDTFMTTYSVLKIAENLQIPNLAFASSSAVYGERQTPLLEESGPLFPISYYGAMKLASEGIISAALESYLEKAWIFRFPNVIGTPATHGVIFDFVRKLKANPKMLPVLGNGTQCKPYLHVSELIEAMLFIVENAKERLNYFNIGADDKGATVKFIAEKTVKRVSPTASIEYGTEDRGWVGDVPKFEYSVKKLATLGWRPQLSSPEAVKRAVDEIASQEGF